MSFDLKSSFNNFMSGLGTSNDQGSYTDFCARKRTPISKIEGALRVDPILRNIVEAAPLDAIRAWREFGDADEVSLSQWSMYEQQFNYEEAIEEALIYCEVYGGVVVVPSYDEAVVSRADYQRPLDMSVLQQSPDSLRGFLVFSASEIQPANKKTTGILTDDDNVFPELWEIKKKNKSFVKAKDRILIHRSWMHVVKGPRKYKHDRPQIGNGHFGESRVDIMFDYLSRAVTSQMAANTSILKSTIDVFYGNFAEDLDNCKGDPAKIEQFFADVSGRLSQAMSQTSSNHPISLDKKNEELDRLGTNNNSAQMEQLNRFHMEMLAAARQMPIVRALGQRNAGLGDDARGQLVNWYDVVGAFRSRRMKGLFNFMDGFVSIDKQISILKWSFGDLMPLSKKDFADISKTIAERDQIYANTIGLPFSRAHIMRNLASEDIYPFTEDQIAQVENRPPSIDDE